MTHARALATAALLALLAGAAQAQATADPPPAPAGGAGTELAPDEAVAPAERPADVPLAPAEGAPAPSPRPSGTDADATPPEAQPGQAGGADAGADGEGAPRTTPRAVPAPPPDPAAPARAPSPDQSPGAPEASPLPAEDPSSGAGAPADAPAPAAAPVPEQLAEDDLELAACLGRLGELGARFERVEPVDEEGGACGIVNPIRVTGIVPGVALEPAGVMRCETATALAGWVATFVLPASRMLPDRGPLAAIGHGSAYVCRRVGGADAGGEFSQHAFGNAIDVMAFRFAEGEPVPVEPREREGTAAEAFQRTARASACLLFTTVLGPGEADHDDHLHLDIEARGSGYRLCQ